MEGKRPKHPLLSQDSDLVPELEIIPLALVPEEPSLSLGARATITNEVELEAARKKSVELASQPPSSAGKFSPLSLADMVNLSEPPEKMRRDASTLPPNSSPLASQDAGPSDPEGDMRDRFALGDFSGALEVAEALLAKDPTHEEAADCASKCREVLIKMYTARLGPLSKVPFVAVATTQLHWLSMDHRAGFVLSHVDGASTIEEVLDVSGMPKLDALRILYELFQQRIIGFR